MIPRTDTWTRGRTAAAGFGLISAGALTAAYVSQYGFGLAPCELCLYQRIPYLVVVGIAFIAALPNTPAGRRRILVALMGLAFFGNALVAGFHTGVEQGWWSWASECTGGADLTALSPEEMRAALGRPAVVPCDQPQWDLFGVTMAGYNTLASAGLAFLAGLAVRRKDWW